jgi:hypothetical protein
MKKKLPFFVLGALSAALAFGGSASAATVVGIANGGNCIPFACGSFGVLEYQQVYSSTDFSGSMSINDIIFYTTNNVGTVPENGTFQLSLSYTPMAVNGLFINLASNIGTGSTTVFTGSLPALVSGELVIPFSTSFVYDPSLGNLLLTVVASGISGGSSGFDAGSGAGIFSRAYQQGTNTFVDNGYGLVTGFDDSVSATPLPAAFPLFATGLGALGLLGWRRKRKDAAAIAA